MQTKTTRPEAYIFATLAAATVVAAFARTALAGTQRQPVPAEVAPRRSMSPDRAVTMPVVALRPAPPRFLTIEYARAADLMAYALMMTGLSLVLVAIVHETTFLLPVGLSWCAASIAVAQLRNTTGAVGALLFGLAGLAGGADAFRFGLTHFGSVWDFAPSLFALIGSAGAAAFGGLDLAARFGGRVGRWTTRGAVALIAAATLGVGATGASAVATVVARDGVSSADRAGAQDLQMKDVRFAPAVVQAVAGQPVRLVVRNDDLILHTFTLPEAGVDIEIGTGSEDLVTLTLPDAGTYAYICTVPGHEAMVGTILVAAP